MAEYYCDISAVGNEYQAYAATPTWGALSTDKPLPMDGNGKAGPGHSAAVAIAEIDVSSASVAATNTLTIAGAVLTAVASGAGANQFNVASGSTLATNLVSSINAATNTVNSGSSAMVPRLQDFCFARVKPGASSVVQIATRIAGTDMNQATNSNTNTTTSGWSVAPTITQFAGGADGPFAYLCNNATIFNKAALAYGLWFAVANAPSDPGASDVVHVRSKRSGSSLSFTYSAGGTHTASWKTRNYLYDDGTIWSGDNGTLAMTFKNTGAAVTNSFTIGASVAVTHVSRSKYNLEVFLGATSASAIYNLCVCSTSTSNQRFAFQACKFTETSDTSSSVSRISLALDGSTTNNFIFELEDSYFTYRGTQKTLVRIGNSSTGWRVRLNGATIEVVAATGAIGIPVQVSAASAFGIMEWIGGEIKDSNGVYSCVTPVSADVGVSNTKFVLDGVVGITDPSIGWTASANVDSQLIWNSPEGTNKGFRIERPDYVVDWKGDGTFPYCGAKTLQGTDWSHRITWNSIPSINNKVVPLRLSRFYRSAAASKTVTLEFLIPDAITVYDDELELRVTYMDSSNVWRIETVGGLRGKSLQSSRTALSSSATSWSNPPASHSAKKIALTTAQSIKQNSEVFVTLSLCASRSPSRTIYVSPDVVLS